MAIIPKYTLNEKFENGKKPPQWDFWAWQDSYWHKEEKIPTAAVEGLDSKLQKKADLIDNMIDVNQLPFSVVTSEILALGKVEIVNNKVKLAVHSSTANKVRVKGKLITRTFPNEWPFTPIAGNGFKVLRGYAVKTSEDFLFAESAELPEITDPEIPENALELFKFTLSAAGSTLVQEDLLAFQLKANEAWVDVLLNGNGGIPQTLSIHHAALRFNIFSNEGNIKIGGFRFSAAQYLYNGVEITLRNDTAGVLEVVSITEIGVVTINADGTPIKLQRFESLKLAYHVVDGVFYALKSGDGGSASFPANGVNGDPLVKDTTAPEGVKFSNVIPARIETEEINRANADTFLSGKIDTNTANISLKENSSNKSFDIETDKASSVKYPTVKSIYDWVVSKLSLKVDKVTGTNQRFAFLKMDGSLDGNLPGLGSPVKVMGVNATNIPITAETVEFKTISTAVTPPSIIDLDALGTDRVDCPNLDRIYFKYGAKWGFINITEI